MRIYRFAKVIEYQNSSEEIFYHVDMLKRDEVVFKDKSAMISFIKHNALALLKMENVNSLSVKFVNKNKKVHYIIIDYLNKDDEPIVYEETEFEYMRTHRTSFKKYARRRKIDDRNYSLSDISRAAVNWSPNFNILNLFLAIVVLVFSSVYVVMGLDYVLETNHSLHPLNYISGWVWQVLLFVPFAVGCILVTYFSFNIYYTNIQIKKSIGDYQDVDWKKWFKIKIRLIRIVMILTLIVLACVSIFLYCSSHEGVDIFSYIGVTSLILWGLIYLIQFSLGAAIHYSIGKNMRKYYPGVRRSTFKKWISAKQSSEKRMSDTNSFIFEPFSSEGIALSKMGAASRIMKRLDKDDIKKLNSSNKAVEKNIKKTYITLTEEIKNANTISKNN